MTRPDLTPVMMETQVKFAFVLGIIGTSLSCFISCQKFDAAPTASPEIVTEKNQTESAPRPNVGVSLSEVGLGNCLSLALLVERLSDQKFDYPAAMMVTEFQVLGETVASGHAKFLAHSSFYYRVAPAKELVPFTKVYQADCKIVKLTMASKQLLTYTILESSDRYLKLHLANEFGDDVPNYQRDALFNRYQSEEISIRLDSESEIKITKKIKSFDPFCKKKKKGYEVRVTHLFSWKKEQADLPTQYQIEKSYLDLVNSALKTPVNMDPEKPVAVETIKNVMTAPALDEIKLCE